MPVQRRNEISRFADAVQALLQSFPSEEEKQRFVSALDDLMEVLRKLRADLSAVPTKDSYSGLADQLSRISEHWQAVSANPALRQLTRRRASGTASATRGATADEKERANRFVRDSREMDLGDIRKELQGRAAAELRAIAQSLGLKTDSRTSKSGLTQQIYSRIANERGYRHLSGSAAAEEHGPA
jgi:hypothetical protein